MLLVVYNYFCYIGAFFAELQQTTAELQQKNSLTNHVKIYGNQTKNEKVYWKKIVEADGTITIGSTQVGGLWYSDCKRASLNLHFNRMLQKQPCL